MTHSPAILTIDQGNTAAKVKIFSGGELLYSSQYAMPDIEQIAAAIDRWHPAAGVYSSIGKIDVKLAESLRPLLSGALLVLTHDTPLPISISYDTPETLGPDRIAAACGAAALAPHASALIVDAGTCITLDLLDARRGFLGGDIAPGVQMRLKAMHTFTRSLPAVEAKGPLPECGTDTATAMRCGAVRGAAAQIRDAYARTLNRLPDSSSPLPLFLTGGDAPLLASLLKDIPTLRLTPHLNAFGLISILQHNEYI